MKKNILYVVAVAMLFFSCKKSADSPALETFNFSKESLTYVQIPLNKYFIYKDSVSSNTDSVIVTQSALVTQLMPAHQSGGFFDPIQPAYNYQTFTLLLSKINGNTSTDWFYGIANTDSYVSPDGLLLRERDRSTNADKNYVFSQGSKIISPGSQIIITNITIEGKDYSHVIQFTSSNGILPSSSSYHQYYLACTYYWAKGIGIIKRTVTTATSTQTWTLVRRG